MGSDLLPREALMRKLVLLAGVFAAAVLFAPPQEASAQLQCMWGQGSMRQVTATYVMRETRSVMSRTDVELAGRPQCGALQTEWTANTPRGRYFCRSDDSLDLEDTVCVRVEEEAEGSVDTEEVAQN
jgi:hypothetical protein